MAPSFQRCISVSQRSQLPSARSCHHSPLRRIGFDIGDPFRSVELQSASGLADEMMLRVTFSWSYSRSAVAALRPDTTGQNLVLNHDPIRKGHRPDSSRTASSPHPCALHGSAPAAQRRVSIAPSRPSLIRPPWPGAATRDENRVGPLPSSRPSATTSPSNLAPHDPGDFPFRMRYAVGAAEAPRGKPAFVTPPNSAPDGPA
jgi:hypothetical protein